MHLVCIVRPGDNNEELRHAARSWDQHLPVASLTTIGYRPDWLNPDQHIDGNRHDTKPVNVYDNIRIAATHPDVAEQHILMNDDFFALKPVDHIPHEWRDTLDEHIGTLGASWWRESLEATRGWLNLIGTPGPLLSYELHRPFPVIKAAMAQVLDEAANVCPANPPQWRTLYGNRWQVGGTQDADIKVTRGRPRPIGMDRITWLSTTDQAFRTFALGSALRDRFPTPSRWEL